MKESSWEAPLTGITVLDLTSEVAGPYCTRLLADWGAEVLKLEHPDFGDGCRRMGPFPDDIPHHEKSGLFFYLNINKLGLTLNLHSKTGRSIFLGLVERADVVVEGFRPGVMKELGLDYEGLAQMHPNLIMTSVSDFGQVGPYHAYRSSNLVAEAMGAWIYRLGEPGRGPVQTGGSLAFYAGGLMAAIGTAAAVHQRTRFGGGQHVDTSLQEAVINALVFPTVAYSVTGRDFTRRGNAAPGVYPCQDGYIGVNALTPPHWETLFRWTGREELLEDPRFSDGAERQANRQEMVEELAPFFVDKRKTELFLKGQEMRLPLGSVSTIEDLFMNEHLQARGFFQQVRHPALGTATIPRPPFQMSLTPWRVRRSAPLLGEHNEQIYCGRLGFSRIDLVRLCQQGVV